jgi:hypothetical protein
MEEDDDEVNEEELDGDGEYGYHEDGDEMQDGNERRAWATDSGTFSSSSRFPRPLSPLATNNCSD